ncbi:MAG: SusC/RagA family TonB-linked outer membrane protein, partial [Bacteroidales bacterium]|nr:SusC/RagA family TonB-linked outer membrane protein [Bacteroidales bacterium]
MKKNNYAKMWFFALFGLLLFSSSTIMAQRTITGTVISNDDKMGIPGVSVTVKGTNTGTSTNISGQYSLSVPSTATHLMFSVIGMTTQEVEIGGQTTIDVTMSFGSTELEEVVVVGFGSQKKANLIGAVASVSAEAFENRPTTGVGQALQGLIPNLNVTVANGGPDAVPSLNIRGGTSIGQDASGNWVVLNGSPLIIVDGVEVSETILNQMNPNDFASMSTIKDASAAAIYGTKAAFGVILFTTKTGGFNQRAKINYSYETMLNRPSALPDIMNSEQIQTYIIENYEWTRRVAPQIELDKLAAIKRYLANPTPENVWVPNGSQILWVGNQNPYEEAVKNWYAVQKHSFSISGGGESVNYHVSLGYQNEGGAYKIGEDFQKRYNAALRINAKVNPWFNMDAKLTYNRTEYEGPYIAPWKGAIWSQLKLDADKNVMMPMKSSPNDPTPNAYTDNYLSWLSYGARTFRDRQTTILSMTPEFILIPKMLKFRTDFAYTLQGQDAKRRSPEHWYLTYTWNLVSEDAEVRENRARLEKTNWETYQINSYLDFNHTISRVHAFAGVLGASQEQTTYTQQVANLRKLFSPDIMNPTAVEDVSLNRIEIGQQRRTGRALFGRANYTFDNKYLLEFNARYDGSSRFTKNERFIFCPSYSAGWRVLQEKFIRDVTPTFIDDFKLRFTSGILLNQPDSYYPYQAVMTANSANYLIDDQLVTRVNVPALVSSALTFEKVRTNNFGLDLSMMNSKLIYTFEYFHRKTSDILVIGDVAYSSMLGANAPLTNSGVMETRGVDMSLAWKDRMKNGLRYGITLNLGDAQSTVLYFPSNPTKTFSDNQLYDGKKIGEIWGYETGGILQESDLVWDPVSSRYIFYGPSSNGAATTGLWPGNSWVKDLDGDGFISSGTNTVGNSGDLRVIGNNTPRFRYSAILNASYKGFDINMLFQGVGKRDAWLGTTYWGGGTNSAGSLWMYERAWRPDR